MNTALRIIVALVFSVVIVFAGIKYNGKSDERAAARANEQRMEAEQAQKNLMDKLKIEDVKVGTGHEAKIGETVIVHYVGTFDDGKKFDSSRDAGEPFQFNLGEGRVIQGWDLGIPGMKIGGIRKLTVPPELGYGANGYGPIPGNATLHFEVELLGVVAPQEGESLKLDSSTQQ